MKNDFPTAPTAPGQRGAGGGTVEKSFTASHTKIQTRPNLEGIKSLGITNLHEVTEHHITDAVGSRSHVVRFINGGVLQFAYNDQGKLLELSATNLLTFISNDNEIQFRVPDREPPSSER